MSKTRVSLAERDEAAADLRKLIQPQDTVYTVLRHAAPSGMSRIIDLLIPFMTEKRFSVYKPTLAQLRAEANEVYVIPPAGESSRDRDDTGICDLLSIDRTQGRVRFKYGRNAGQEMDMPRDRLMVVEPRQVPAIRSIGWLAAKAMGDTYDRDRSGIRIGGCGMDMGFALVYNLGRTLWPDGTGKAHGTRNGESDTDGGYALKHSWL